ncbi:hypothetical protein K438DRAFT_1874732, partial [Mycena galopus ATCC 62051]
MIGAFLPFQIHHSVILWYQLSKVWSFRLRDDSQFGRLHVSDWKALFGLVPEVKSLHIYATTAPQCTRAVILALQPPKLFPPSLPILDAVLCPGLKSVNITEEMDLPLLNICFLAGEHISYVAPEIHFTIRNSAPPRHRTLPVTYNSDSDSDFDDHGYDVPDSGPHTQRVEFIKFEERVIKVTPPAWATNAFTWHQYFALLREYY